MLRRVWKEFSSVSLDETVLLGGPTGTEGSVGEKKDLMYRIINI